MAKNKIWKSLTDEHKGELIKLAVYACNLNRKNPRMKALATHLIKQVAWRWTADGSDREDNFKLNVLKYDIRPLSHTAGAKIVTNNYPNRLDKPGLVHEHIFPLKLLVEKVLSLKTYSEEAVGDVFGAYCIAAVVKKEENNRLNEKFRSEMPPEWTDIKERYKAVDIELLEPEGFHE